MTNHVQFLKKAIALAKMGMDAGEGGPFGVVIVKDGTIIAEGNNKVLASNDPTAHAEIVAIRKACSVLNSYQLEDCIIYSSCEPCPMCLGAIYWARPKAVYYASSRVDATVGQFDDEFIYTELDLPGNERSIPFIQIPIGNTQALFERWLLKGDKKTY